MVTIWLLTPNGFYSAVAHADDPGLLVVRSRVLQDAEHLAKWVEDQGWLGENDDTPPQVEAYRGSDYEWRVILPREAWEGYLTWEASQISYTNFKNEVTRRQGHERHDIYSRVWSTLLALARLPGAKEGHAERAVPHPKYGSWTYPFLSSRLTAKDFRDEGHAEACDLVAKFDDLDADCTCGEWYSDTLLDDADARLVGVGMHADCTKHGCVAPVGYQACHDPSVTDEPKPKRKAKRKGGRR